MRPLGARRISVWQSISKHRRQAPARRRAGLRGDTDAPLVPASLGSSGFFIGLGGSYRTRAGPDEGNFFNGSHANFTEQLGVRWMRPGHREGIEISFRHFSNLGIVRPNIGQNFIDLALVF